MTKITKAILVGDKQYGNNTEYAISLLDEDGNSVGVGAEETAYFVATGPTDVTDGIGAAGNLNFVVDSRYGDLPDWVSLSNGDIILSSDAGTCAWALTGVIDYDFSATTPPDSDGVIYASFQVAGGSPFGVMTAGDGQDAQTSSVARSGGVVVPGTLTAHAFPVAYSDTEQITPINDGAGTPRVALTVTRIAQAAILP